MIRFKRGDIVLVEVIFSEGTGGKKRPALIISKDEYNLSREEVIIAAITSNIDRKFIGETLIKDWRESGLLCKSMVTGIIQTIKRNLILKKIGKLTDNDFRAVDNNFGNII